MIGNSGIINEFSFAAFTYIRAGMGHSDISVTMNVYTHIGFDDAEKELKRMEDFRKAQAEIEQKKDKPMSQKMFKVI